MPRAEVLEQYFMQNRAMVLDVAAFLDRVERADPKDDAQEDFRITAFREAIKVLIDGKPERAKRVLNVFSDQTEQPLESSGQKSAAGA